MNTVDRLRPALGLVLLLTSVVGAQMPEVGKAAPAFTAEDQGGRSVAFPPKGQWAVLAFYPRAATPG
jgi:hypothetical protein